MKKLDEIKKFAFLNMNRDDEDQVYVDMEDVALTNPWIDRSARFELSDEEAVKTWGLKAVLEFCFKAEEAMKKNLLCGCIWKIGEDYSFWTGEISIEDREDIMRILKKYKNEGTSILVNKKDFEKIIES